MSNIKLTMKIRIWHVCIQAMIMPKIRMSRQIILGTVKSIPMYCRLFSFQMSSRVSPKSSSWNSSSNCLRSPLRVSFKGFTMASASLKNTLTGLMRASVTLASFMKSLKEVYGGRHSFDVSFSTSFYS